MQAITIAHIVFAETRQLSFSDNAGQDALKQARLALAKMVDVAGGIGFAPAVEPTPEDLASADGKAAWADCLAAANGLASAPSPAGDVCVFDDGSLKLPDMINTGLAQATASGTFLSAKGLSCQLKIFSSPSGMAAGRYPRGPAQPVVTGKSGRLQHQYVLGFVLLVLFGGLMVVGGWAYHRGTSLAGQRAREIEAWRAPDRKSAFDGRLTAALQKVTGDAIAHSASLKPADAAPGQAALGAALVAAVDKALPVNSTVDSIPLPSPAQTHDYATKASLQAALAYDALPATNPLAKDATLRQSLIDAASHAVSADPLFASGSSGLLRPWIAAAVLILAIIGAVGHFLRRTVFGAMIDGRNRLSLSMLQMSGWTVLIFSLFYIASLFLMGVTSDFLLPVCDSGIWALLGLSIGSTAVSRVILDRKDNPPADSNGVSDSLLHRRDDAGAWSFSDLFMGEETGNADTVDLSRVQQVVITVVLMVLFVQMAAIVVGCIVWPAADWTAWAGQAIPNLAKNETYLGMLAVSHGSYLVFKGLPKPGGA